MQLIAILLVTVALLTLLSGIATFFGATRGDRAKSAWFFVATVFATIWMASIAVFLVADKKWGDLTFSVNLTYISSIFIDIALLGYISWRQKYGKIITVLFLVAGIALSIVFASNHTLLYEDIIIANSGNSLVTNIGPFYFVYIAFFCLLVPTVITSLLIQIFGKRRSSRTRHSDLVLLIGFGISGTMSLIFNLIMPLWTWNLVWLGPLAISTTIIAFYYSILRYHALNLSSRWLKLLSYIVIVASGAVIYMVIFYIIFAAMFRGSTPSVEVIMLNFIMILIVLLLIPAMSEINMFVRSLISRDQVDMVYIIKKLSKVTPRGVNLNELAAFLAEHMHFEYIGFLVDGQIYGSDNRKISSDSVEFVKNLGNPEDGIWQEFDEDTKAWKDLNLSAVAALRSANGKIFGQVMVGKPAGKVSFSRRDLVQVETIINLSAVIIDSKSGGKR